MYAINEDIIKKFVWIPDLLEKVLRNETTPAVKNSMNTIAKRVLGHGLIFCALYRSKIDQHSDSLRSPTGEPRVSPSELFSRNFHRPLQAFLIFGGRYIWQLHNSIHNIGGGTRYVCHFGHERDQICLPY